MNTLEGLPLLLVVFAALSYIDEHKKKQHPTAPKLDAISFEINITEGNRKINSDNLSKQIIH